MCFFKNSCAASQPLYNNDSNCNNGNNQSPQIKCSFNSQSDLGAFQNVENFSPFFLPDYTMLSYLLGNLTANSEMLLKLQKDIDSSEQMLDEALLLASPNPKETEKGKAEQVWDCSNKTVRKLFGDQQYRYRLKLKGKFPSTIYKERNINLSFQLLDHSGKLVLNSNLIHLCMAVSETNGEWIPENEEGDYFIKGKTEVEMYHGEVSFQKVYPRDVSRQFKNGKVNIIVYAKPSLIEFSTSSSSVQERVRAEEIEPLLISDVTIRAKKKSAY